MLLLHPHVSWEQGDSQAARYSLNPRACPAFLLQASAEYPSPGRTGFREGAPEPAADFEADDAEDGFTEDAGAHL